jgi:hypothetical protein
MITRKEYMANSSEMFESFYGQFVTNETKGFSKGIAIAIAKDHDKIDSALNQYKSLHYWDSLAANVRIPLSVYNAAYEKTDNSVWVSDKLCILKNAVRAELLQMGFVESEEYRNGFTDKILVKVGA